MNALKSILIAIAQVALMMLLYHWVAVQRRGNPPFLGMLTVYLLPPILALLANALVVRGLSRSGRSGQSLSTAVVALCLTLLGFWVGLGLSTVLWR